MDVYLGMIFLFAGNFAPRGFAFCAGQLLPIQQNTALFSLLGTYYGGDGRVTFGLPDLRGRAPIGVGQGPGLADFTLGEAAGTETATLTISNMPIHTHTLTGNNASGGHEYPGPNHVLGQSATDLMYSTNQPNTTMSPASITSAGGSIPFSIQQPYLALNYIIATSGLFPSRN